MNRKATIREVAATAGVSIATVSRYLNGAQRFSSDVEVRIRQAVRSLNYGVGRQQRASTATRAIGVVVFTLASPSVASVMRGVNRIALQNGYSLAVLEIGDFFDASQSQGETFYGYSAGASAAALSSAEQDRLDAFGRSVSGFLLGARVPQPHLEYLRSYEKPVVIFGSRSHAGMPVVGADSYRATRLVGELLVAQGHRHVTYIGVPTSPWNCERELGIVHLLEERGVRHSQLTINDLHLNDVAKVCDDIVQGHERPDALVCYNDVLALTLLQELNRRGIDVPGDVSLTGIENTLCSRFSSPALTTVDLQHERYGEIAMQLVLRRLHEAIDDEDGRVLLEPKLIVRNSTRSRTADAYSSGHTKQLAALD
jgi:LacI family transcriptional regulator